MKTIFLKDFIKTGNFDCITLGSSIEEVIAVLGDDFTFNNLDETQILCYGWYEFFVWAETGKVYGIQNDKLLNDCINHAEMINFKSDKWILEKWFLRNRQDITFREIKTILTKEHIDFTVQPTYPGCDENIIKCTDSSVTFDFCGEYRAIEQYADGDFKELKKIVETDEDCFVLNGIRLFKNP